MIRLAGFIAECEETYGIKIVYGNTIKMKYEKKKITEAIIETMQGRKHYICSWDWKKMITPAKKL